MGTAGSLLVVCTANVCRSPLAERLLAGRLSGLRVRSAGVHALAGAPMCSVSATELPPGADPAHVATQVDRAAVSGADLVVAMERDQRGALVRLLPGSQAKVFTLLEAAVLAEALAAEGVRLPDLAAVAAALHARRGVVPMPVADPPRRRWFRAPAEPDDPVTIPDGHGGPEPVHRAAVARVHAVADRLGAALAAVLDQPGSSPDRASADHSSDASSASPATDGWKESRDDSWSSRGR